MFHPVRKVTNTNTTVISIALPNSLTEDALQKSVECQTTLFGRVRQVAAPVRSLPSQSASIADG